MVKTELDMTPEAINRIFLEQIKKLSQRTVSLR